MLSDAELAPIIDLLKNKDISGWFKSHDGGPYLREFQKKFAALCGTKYAFGVSSGNAAIYVGLRACGVDRGDWVAVPTYTHIGSVAPIALAGAKPLFVDVDKYGNIDPRDLKRSMENKKVKAIVVVHQLGQPCEMDEIKNIAPDIHIVEDASHALGAEYKGEKAGSLGSAGCFSIGGGRTKTVGTGEGGMVTVNDDELAERCKNIRNHGDRSTDVSYLCFNFRMSDLNAAVGLAQIDRVPEFNNWQIENAKYITENLPDCLTVPEPPPHIKSVRYIIGCYFHPDKAGMTRDQFLRQVKDTGFEGGVPRKNIGGGYAKLISDVRFYQKYRKRHRFPMAERIRDEAVWIDYHRYPRTKGEIDELMKVFRLICP